MARDETTFVYFNVRFESLTDYEPDLHLTCNCFASSTFVSHAEELILPFSIDAFFSNQKASVFFIRSSVAVAGQITLFAKSSRLCETNMLQGRFALFMKSTPELFCVCEYKIRRVNHLLGYNIRKTIKY